MPFVTRPSDYGYNQPELLRVGWKDATRAEKIRALYLRTAGAIAAASLAVSYGEDIVGQPMQQISELEQVTALRASARQEYVEASLADKYRISFLQRLRSKTLDNDRGGRGIRGFFSNPDMTARIMVGRNCLNGTAYDTNTDNGNPPAALNPTDEKHVSIYSAAPDAAPLHFRLDENANFKPDAETRSILIAYNCHFLGGIPVREAFYSSNTEPLKVISPLFAPDETSLEQ